MGIRQEKQPENHETQLRIAEGEGGFVYIDEGVEKGKDEEKKNEKNEAKIVGFNKGAEIGFKGSKFFLEDDINAIRLPGTERSPRKGEPRRYLFRNDSKGEKEVSLYFDGNEETMLYREAFFALQSDERAPKKIEND
jgi:hypothetical protein